MIPLMYSFISGVSLVALPVNIIKFFSLKSSFIVSLLRYKDTFLLSIFLL